MVLATMLAPAGAALAQSAPYYAAPRYRLVGTMLSSSQVLLWDERIGQYQLNRPGDVLDGMRILAIEPDRLLLNRGGQVVALLLSPTPRRQVMPRRVNPMPAPIAMMPPDAVQPHDAQPESVQPAPQAAPDAETAPLASPIPETAPQAPPVDAPQAPPIAAQPDGATQPTAPPAAVPPPIAASPATPRPATITISRDEFESELGDFGKLAQEVVLAPLSGGGYRLDALRPGCYLERLGLRAGDVVLSIDGRAINEPDDAARAYAWLQVTDHFTVDVLRDGSRLRLSYRITGASASL